MEEEGDIVISGTYTTRSGQEVPVQIHTNKTGIIYQRWQQEMAHRSGGGPREIKEGEIYEIEPDPILKAATLEVMVEKPRGKTLIEVLVEEDQKKIRARLEELRRQLRYSTDADAIREEIASLEKKILGDP